MKKIYIAFLGSAIIMLTGCASSGSGPVSENYCPKSYSSSTALLLGDLAKLAYEENSNKISSELSKRGFTLDPYDIRNKKYSVGGFIAINNDTAVLAFAGTDGLKDWKNNAKTWSESIEDPSCGKNMRMHKGFQKTAMEIIKNNNHALLTHLASLQSQGKKIYITGHSLGGALATITAYYTKTATPSVDIAGIYTFGQPYTGDDDFQGCYDSRLKDRTFRFVSDKDVVPKTRVDSSYRHVGVFLFFDENGDLQNSKPSNYAGDLVDFVKSDLLDAHSMSSYQTLLLKNKVVNPFSCQ